MTHIVETFHQAPLRKYFPAIACGIVFVLAMLIYALAVAHPVVQGKDPVLFTVTEGMSAKDIADALAAKNVIRNKQVFRLVAKIDGLDSSLQAGEYEFLPGMSIQQIINNLANGRTVYRLLTIPEGYTVEQIASLLEKQNLGSAEKFKEIVRQPDGSAYLSAGGEGVIYHGEGFLFPATYRIRPGTDETEIAQLMLKKFATEFTPEMQAQAAAEGLSVHDVVTLASLVEREARVENERPVIAGIFLRRLALGMPLQSCATVQYLLGDPKANLSIADTQIPSPYNTYLHYGLPPGPIANPGLPSIKAVLNAAQTPYLYFVATNQGTHVFSVTYEEHLAAIARIEGGSGAAAAPQ